MKYNGAEIALYALTGVLSDDENFDIDEEIKLLCMQSNINEVHFCLIKKFMETMLVLTKIKLTSPKQIFKELQNPDPQSFLHEALTSACYDYKVEIIEPDQEDKNGRQDIQVDRVEIELCDEADMILENRQPCTNEDDVFILFKRSNDATKYCSKTFSIFDDPPSKSPTP